MPDEPRRFMMREALKAAIDRLKAEGQIIVDPETPEQRAQINRELRIVRDEKGRLIQ